jgi:histidinol-phosphatase
LPLVNPTLDEDLALAHRLADAASRVSLSYFKQELKSWSKDDGSLATEADLAVEDEIRADLGVARASDAILGEERGQTGSSKRRWILDGIDGTVQFAAASPEWYTLIALEVEGEIVVSVCDQPTRKRRYWATKGGGAFRTDASSQAPRKLQVSDARDLASARSYVPPAEWRPDERSRRISAALTEASRPEVSVDHPALQVAFGGYDLAVFLFGGPWDVAGPLLVVEEAGGRFSDIAGKHDWMAGTAVFSNGLLHDDVLRIIGSTQGA